MLFFFLGKELCWLRCAGRTRLVNVVGGVLYDRDVGDGVEMGALLTGGGLRKEGGGGWVQGRRVGW